MTENYTMILEEMFSKFVKKYNQLQLSEYDGKTILQGNSLILEGMAILKSIRSHCVSLESLLSDCADFVKELEDKDERPPNYEPIYVYKNKNNILSYPGKSYINAIIDEYEDNKAAGKAVKPNSIKRKPTNSPLSSRVMINEIGHNINIHTVANLADIPPALFYHPETDGIYIRLPNNNLFKIPFPEIVDSRKDNSRNQSIRCKYKNKPECDAQRVKMATIYNSTVRVCNFAHKGDKIVKIGHQSRCPSAPSYGNLESLSTDIKTITDGDVKSMLLYGLNDIFMASLWLDHAQIKNKVVINLDVV
jgi:hypothetical protein